MPAPPLNPPPKRVARRKEESATTTKKHPEQGDNRTGREGANVEEGLKRCGGFTENTEKGGGGEARGEVEVEETARWRWKGGEERNYHETEGPQVTRGQRLDGREIAVLRALLARRKGV